MELLIIDEINEFNITLDESYQNKTLYDILVQELKFNLNEIYTRQGKKIPLKLPIKQFRNKKVIFTKDGYKSFNKYEKFKNKCKY